MEYLNIKPAAHVEYSCDSYWNSIAFDEKNLPDDINAVKYLNLASGDVNVVIQFLSCPEGWIQVPGRPGVCEREIPYNPNRCWGTPSGGTICPPGYTPPSSPPRRSPPRPSPSCPMCREAYFSIEGKVLKANLHQYS